MRILVKVPYGYRNGMGETAVFNTILEALENTGVFSIEVQDNGKVYIGEECDRVYGHELNKGELLGLAEEIKQIADNLPEKEAH